MRILNNNKQSFTSISRLANPLGVFYDANATIPTLAIESGVTILRTVEANKKGGKYEASERFIEQGVSAGVWLWGVQALKKTGEFIGEKLFKIENLGFDIGFDNLRNPVVNNKINKNTALYKSANILVSTALATFFIGFILPHLNRILTKKALNNKNNKKKDSLIKQPDFEEFKKSTKKNISFTSLGNNMTHLAHTLENNSTARLLITDCGVIAGRCYNAKTKSHKIENLFRDISSIYFYLFSSSHIVKALNKLSSNTNIDPKALKNTVSMLQKELIHTSVNPQDFLKTSLGEIDLVTSQKIDELFKDRNKISLEEFNKTFIGFCDKAEKMTHLQPIFENKKYLTKLQACDVLKKGLITQPEFLKTTLDDATKGAASNKLKFVSQNKLEKIRYSLDDFIVQIADYAKKNDLKIDKDLIDKVANKTIKKNFIFNVLATALSTLALGILIPKIQYAIRKKLTNNDEFPGDVYYKKS